MNTQESKSPSKLMAWVLEQLQKHGALFILLALFAYYFQTKSEKLDLKLDQCNSELIQMIKETNLKMFELVSNNTNALENNAGAIDNLRITILTTDDQWQKEQRKKLRSKD